MVSERNDVINHSGGYGGYSGGWGGDGILGLIALLSLFRGNFNGGDYGGAAVNLAAIEGQLANVRADIGDVKYDTVSSILAQTNALMAELCNGRMENITAIMGQTNQLQTELFGIQGAISGVKFDLSTQMSAYANETNTNILRMGYENQLANCQQTNILSSQLASCCCETKGLIQSTAFETQLRDLQYKGDTDKQLAEIKCLIKDTAKDQELARLGRLENQMYIANQINRGINATVGHWSADAQFNGVTYPQPPFPGAWGY